jgi:hypothetical protein
MTIDNTHGHHWPSIPTLHIAYKQAKRKDLEANLDPYKVGN